MRFDDIEDIYPLSPMQQGFIFHDLLTPGTEAYFEQVRCLVRGQLDTGAFARAWELVMERHAPLRSGFVWEDLDAPMQIVYRQAQLPIEELDWRQLPVSQQQMALAEFFAEDRQRGFDLAEAPLMRLTLIRLEDDVRQLIWSHHHLLLDGWSSGMLLREVFASYGAFVQGASPQLNPVRPYKDFIAWLQGQDANQAEAFWRAALKGFDSPTLVNLARTTSPTATTGYGECRTSLPRATTEALTAMARRYQLTINTIVQGAWALLLGRYCGAADVVFGATAAGRPAELDGVETMIGLFINTLPVRARIAPEAGIAEWLRELQSQQAAVRQFEYAPLADVQRWSEIGRGEALFETLLVFENYPIETALREHVLQQTGLTISDVRTFEQTNYPLTILAAPGHELSLLASYDRSRFEDAGIERLLAHLAMLLEAIASVPATVSAGASARASARESECRIAELPTLPSDERRQLLAWNATATEASSLACVHDLFAEQAMRTPDAVAVVCGAERLTYAELDRRANQLASYLQQRGVGPDALVGLCVGRSLALAVGVLGILKAGAAYLPLDAAYPRERLAFMLRDAGVSMLLAEAKLTDHLPPHDAAVIKLDKDWNQIASFGGEPVACQASPENLAYVIYTSGSTGQPKGAGLPHRALANLISWQMTQSRLPAGARTVQFAPLSFDVSFQEIFATWCGGGTLMLLTEELRRDSALLWRFLHEERVARLFLPFVALQQLAVAALNETALPESLREIITAGEQLQVTPAIQRMFDRLPGCRLHNQYGPTETHVVTACALSGEASGWEALPPIGRPIARASAYVLDRRMQPAPIGVAGELYLGGDCLARGYVDRPALTADRFSPDPFSQQPGARMYRTGDVARFRPDGNLEFLGRNDQQVKIRGYRVELGEVESALKRHPAIHDAAVAVLQDSDGRQRLVAYLTAPQSPPAATELRAFLQAHLPEYMTPSAFITLDTLPLTPSGKVDRRALPAPDDVLPEIAQGYVGLRTPVQEILAGLWQQVLGIAQVGVQDHFFELGGHSLLATQLISRIRSAFQINISLRSVFDAPTLEALAEVIEQELRSGHPLPPPIAVGASPGSIPISFAQRRLWFLDQLEPGSAWYNLPLAIRLTGAVDISALDRSLSEIVRRHQVLRTRFVNVNGEPQATLAEASSLLIPLDDLSALPPDAREAKVRELAAAEASLPFDLTQSPLLRVRLLRLTQDEHVLLLTIHHIASDGWSLGVLVREVAALYPAFARNEPSPLADLPLQYADYAGWQQGWLQGDALAAELTYWRQQLKGAPAVLALPTDKPRPATQSYRGACETLRFSELLSADLKSLARREGATLFMTLLAAWQALLARYSGQTDLCIGTAIAGRQRREVEDLLGCFVNTLVLRGALDGNPSFIELLQRARESCLGAYAHQDVPFEQIVEALQPQRDLSRAPLFQVMFVLQNAPGSALELLGLTLRAIEVETQTTKFDLTLTVTETEGRLMAALEYDTDLYESPTIQRMLGHLETLLAGVAADPQLRLAELPLLSTDESHQLLHEWNATETETPAECTLADLFEAQAVRTPQSPAVAFAGQELSYDELNRRANQLAHHLQKQGVGAESLVGVYLSRAPEMLIGLLGILKAGAAYVPLDPANPPERLACMLRDAAAPVILTQQKLLPSLPPGAARVLCLDADWPQIAQEREANPARQICPDNLAYVIFTSGSTGTPKGALITHRGLVNYLCWCVQAYEMTEGNGAPVHTSISFDLTVTSLFAPLLAGQCVRLLPPELDAGALSDALAAMENLTFVKLTPSHLELLNRSLPAERAATLTRRLILGGETLSSESLAFWREHAPQTRIVNEYGPTEAVVGSCVYELAGDIPATACLPIGRPLANTQLYLLDAFLRAVPVGVTGELYIGGAGVARGYLNRPDLTAERFIPHPFGDTGGARLYRTGDLARYLADGNLEFLGRADQQIKLRGYRIEPGEIEAALCEHPAIADAIALIQTDERAEPQLVAYVISQENDAAVLSQTLRAFLRQRLPEYMIPAAFVRLDGFPLAASGKLDRAALPAPQVIGRQAAGEFIAPRTLTETTLAENWRSLLNVERVGAHDNFFELGGHSLLATRAISQIREAFQIDISLRRIFELPTLGELSDLIDQMRIAAADEERLNELMAGLDQLSDAEVEALLAGQEKGKGATGD